MRGWAEPRPSCNQGQPQLRGRAPQFSPFTLPGSAALLIRTFQYFVVVALYPFKQTQFGIVWFSDPLPNEFRGDEVAVRAKAFAEGENPLQDKTTLNYTSFRR